MHILNEITIMYTPETKAMSGLVVPIRIDNA